MLKINRLVSGGIITNYFCSSECKHCVYASSPHWPKDYMSADLAGEIFEFLKKSGCHSAHIGGGEPLLRPDSLFTILNEARKSGIQLEYIETNASWYRDRDKAGELIKMLQQYGVDTLLISIDPFHNEYIPFCKVKGLIDACRLWGMSVFPWLMDFWGDLEALDDTRPHQLEEYDRLFGGGYMLKLFKRYQLNLRGRALQTYKPYIKAIPAEHILNSCAPCSELMGTHHFHIDLYGNYIPQSCAGLSMHFKDLARGTDTEKYPVLHALSISGIEGLFSFARVNYGFAPKDSYTGKCDLCYDIRRFLVVDKKVALSDLQPQGHYLYM